MRDRTEAFVAGVAGAVTVVVLMGATAIKTDGSIETEQQLVSTATRGTPPLAVTSTTMVANLNSDTVDGLDASAFALAANSYTMAEVDALIAAYRDARRAFYLTASGHDGGEADGTDGSGAGVCAPGFHFAALWEIRDVSNLRYATDAEAGGDVARFPDSGSGPPVSLMGWIRTGNQSNSLEFGGKSNCSVWTENGSFSRGTVAWLTDDWYSAATAVSPWVPGWRTCDTERFVWCVEDYPGAASV